MTSLAELHDLTGQLAVVTGGSRGIGRAIADVLAAAYAPKVRVNAILPGPVRTDVSKGWAPPEGADVPWVPMRRIGDPAEVAPLALHLASAEGVTERSPSFAS